MLICPRYFDQDMDLMASQSVHVGNRSSFPNLLTRIRI